MIGARFMAGGTDSEPAEKVKGKGPAGSGTRSVSGKLLSCWRFYVFCPTAASALNPRDWIFCAPVPRGFVSGLELSARRNIGWVSEAANPLPPVPICRLSKTLGVPLAGGLSSSGGLGISLSVAVMPNANDSRSVGTSGVSSKPFSSIAELSRGGTAAGPTDLQGGSAGTTLVPRQRP